MTAAASVSNCKRADSIVVQKYLDWLAFLPPQYGCAYGGDAWQQWHLSPTHPQLVLPRRPHWLRPIQIPRRQLFRPPWLRPPPFRPQQLHRTTTGWSLLDSIDIIIKWVQATNQRPDRRCERASLRAKKMAVSVLLLFEDSACSVRLKYMMLPERIFDRLIIRPILRRAVFRKAEGG